MYIDGDTHYWPLRFIDKVSHPGKGYVEVYDRIRATSCVTVKSCRERSRPIIATARRSILSKKGAGVQLRAEFMKKDGFDRQVLIPDNRPLIYELDAELGRQLARAYNETWRKISAATIVSSVAPGFICRISRNR